MLPIPIRAKTLDCWVLIFAFANAVAAFCAAVSAVALLLVAADVCVVPLPLFLGCISSAAFCAAAKSSDLSAWYKRPSGLVLVLGITGSPDDA